MLRERERERVPFLYPRLGFVIKNIFLNPNMKICENKKFVNNIFSPSYMNVIMKKT